MRLQNDIREHKHAQHALCEFCTAHDISEQSTMRLRLLLEEIFLNVATYAYPEGRSGYIDVSFERREEHVLIVIEDEGIPFNPLAEPAPDLTVGVDEREIGGLGIVLIRELADKVDYDYSTGRNRLEIAYKLR